MKINTYPLFTILSFIFMLALSIACQEKKKSPEQQIKGIYGNPNPFIEKYHSLADYGINAVFARKSTFNEDLVQMAKKDNIKLFAEFPLLNGKDYVKDHPEAWPVDRYGHKAEAADWFMGVCLTDSAFRTHRVDELNELLNKQPIDGIWLDYLHWHAQFEKPTPILPETCFCDRCIRLFSQAYAHEIPGDSTSQRANHILQNLEKDWRKWRSEVLTDWIIDFNKKTKAIQPDALLGLYYCPWYPEDYDSALYNNMGIDMEALAHAADVFSPMLYHKKMGRGPEWVKEYVTWLTQQQKQWGTNAQIWPIVQAQDDPGIITPEEFKQVMTDGLARPSGGVMMFSINSLVQDTAKVEVMKNVFLDN